MNKKSVQINSINACSCNNKCIRMGISHYHLGKLSDERCLRKYLIGCQKKQTYLKLMKQQINSSHEDCRKTGYQRSY